MLIKDRVKRLRPWQCCMDIIEQDETKPPRENSGYQMYCRCGFALPENSVCKPICPDCGEALRVVTWRKGDRW